METSLLLGNMIWPAFLTIGVISILDYILDRKKNSRNCAIIFITLGLATLIYFIVNKKGFMFLQVYLFMFLLSISLVILALKKRIDAFTIIGIILMVIMLILLLRFTLIE